jgi:hypothetical protein
VRRIRYGAQRQSRYDPEQEPAALTPHAPPSFDARCAEMSHVTRGRFEIPGGSHISTITRFCPVMLRFETWPITLRQTACMRARHDGVTREHEIH